MSTKKATEKNQPVKATKPKQQNPIILQPEKPVIIPELPLKSIAILQDLDCFNFNGKKLTPTKNNVKVDFDTILQSRDGAVLSKKTEITGKQILKIITSEFEPLPTSECYIYPDNFVFQNRVKEIHFGNEILADNLVPIDEIIFNRYITRLDLAIMPEGTLSFAMKFDLDSSTLEIVIGYNHKICSNFTIFPNLNSIKKISSKFSFSEFAAFVKQIKNGKSELIEEYSKLIKKLTEKPATKSDYLRMLGSAHEQYFQNTTYLQLANLHDVARKNQTTEFANGWDIINAFTLGTRIETGKGNDNLQQLQNTCEFVLNNLNK